MEEKSAHYKLDFKYKFEKENYSIEDILNTGYFNSLRYSIAKAYINNDKRDQFWSLISVEEVNNHKIRHYEYEGLDADTKKQILDHFYQATRDAEYDGYYGSGKYHSSIRYLYNDMLMLAASRTPEYLEAQKKFSEWINTRPGVVKAFKEYREKQNAKREERNAIYREDHPYFQKLIPDSMNLEDIGEHIACVGFRRHLENARPQRYKPGTVVRLRSSYLNKRGKDPFFYVYDSNIKSQERIGTVLKKINTTRNFGQGSREIRVMWFANGEESLLMERCLEKYDPDGKPAATKGK